MQRLLINLGLLFLYPEEYTDAQRSIATPMLSEKLIELPPIIKQAEKEIKRT